VLFFCFFLTKGFPQYKGVENSLLENVQNAKEDTQKINALPHLFMHKIFFTRHDFYILSYHIKKQLLCNK